MENINVEPKKGIAGRVFGKKAFATYLLIGAFAAGYLLRPALQHKKYNLFHKENAVRASVVYENGKTGVKIEDKVLFYNGVRFGPGEFEMLNKLSEKEQVEFMKKGYEQLGKGAKGDFAEVVVKDYTGAKLNQAKEFLKNLYNSIEDKFKKEEPEEKPIK